MKTIVVAYNAEQDDRDVVLDRGLELAAALGARLVLASAIPIPTVPIVAADAWAIAAPVPEESTEAVDQLWQTRLAEAAERARARGITTETVAEHGAPVETVIDIADRFNADLLVVGLHEHGFFERLFVPNVGEGVVRRANCDVFVAHQRQV